MSDKKELAVIQESIVQAKIELARVEKDKEQARTDRFVFGALLTGLLAVACVAAASSKKEPKPWYKDIL